MKKQTLSTKSLLTAKLAENLSKLKIIYNKNLLFAKKLQKKAYNRRVRFRIYDFKMKFMLNGKYLRQIKIPS